MPQCPDADGVPTVNKW